MSNGQPYRMHMHGQTLSPKNVKNPSDLHLPGTLDMMNVAGNMYPGGIGSIAPNSVQNAASIRNHGNQSVTNGMQAQLITPKNNPNLGGMMH